LTVVHGGPLLAFLLAESGLNRTALKNLLKFGAVSVNGETVRQFDHPLVVGDGVAVGALEAAAATARLESARIQLIYEDDALLVLDKPAGLLSVATKFAKTDTLFYRLDGFLRGRDGRRAIRPQVVHRLDQDTSGLVLFAKSAEVKDRLQAAWSAVEKTYWAVVEGRPASAAGTVTSYLSESKAMKVHSRRFPTKDAQLATTHFRVAKAHDGLALLEVRLETGRKHQIRVHLADLACPVAGDERYGAKSNPCGRLGLHAGGLRLTHPMTGATLFFESPLPKALSRLFP
jgi:23S rRNA pseudouridine1911/1915/1917 synthase